MASRVNYSSFKEYPGPIKRQGPFNLDSTSSYNSIEEALKYAQESPAAYEGQLLSVTETNPDGSTALSYYGIRNDANGVATLVSLLTQEQAGTLAIYRQE